MQGCFFLDVVIGQQTIVFELLSSEDEPLLIGWYAFFVLYFLLYHLDAIRSFHLDGYRLSRQRLHKDLHLRRCSRYKHTSMQRKKCIAFPCDLGRVT